MRCLTCGAEMDLIEVVPDTTMMVAGYEHHTLQCSACSEVERRLVFSGRDALLQPQKFPAREAPSAPPPAAPAADGAEIASAWRRTFAKLRARQGNKGR
jgi:hypothetical protein